MAQTKQYIQEILQAAHCRPQHKWGQNFLIDLNLMHCLVAAACLQPSDTVLEVGTGTGSLTEQIAQRAGAVVSVEIDRKIAAIAAAQLSAYQNISLIHTDILATKNSLDPAVLAAVDRACHHFDRPFKLVANLPYQIASPLIVNLLLDTHKPCGMFVTVQAEVAQRQFPARHHAGLGDSSAKDARETVPSVET